MARPEDIGKLKVEVMRMELERISTEEGSSQLKTEAASRIVDSLQPVSVQGTKEGFVYTADSAFGCCRDPFDLCFPTDIASGKSPSEYRTHSGRGSLDLVRILSARVLRPLALERSLLRG